MYDCNGNSNDCIDPHQYSFDLVYLQFVEDLSDTLTGLVEHLDQVHSLETFYGEPVLQSLLRHTRDVVEEVDQYMAIYEVVEEGDKPEVEEEEQEEQEIDE